MSRSFSVTLGLLPMLLILLFERAASGASPTTVCASACENTNATLACPSGMIISNIVFASYGTPTGRCGSYRVKSSCDTSTSMSVVQNARRDR
jgi:hypothetical protein